MNGNGDHTPTVFEPGELKGYTWAWEFAQAVVFTSAFQCCADHPQNYLKNPTLDVLQVIPVVWDETPVLPGSEIGECAAFARRKRDRWFMGFINGDTPRTIKLPPAFLGGGNWKNTTLADDP